MDRRDFLRIAACAVVAPRACDIRAQEPPAVAPDGSVVMTVRGPRPATELGITLPHEHVLVDFIGAAEVSPARYDASAAFAKIKPFLERVRGLGCTAMFECTPAYLGRDVRLLVRLSTATGVTLVTNTGYYAARQDKFLPAHAAGEDADALAARWLREWTDGIDGTKVRPGFVKLGFDAGPLSRSSRKLVQAAARTHRASGLTIAAHSGDDVAAREQLTILQYEGVRPEAWVWVHAQNAKDVKAHAEIARAGAWLSFDGIAPNSIPRYVQLVTAMKEEGFLRQVLISQDAGWYRPGEPEGGRFRDYDALFRAFLPALRRAGITEEEIRLLTVTNPARAFAVRMRVA
jgi:predicted metal-dependent phosphotriesterase family hydrolase